MSAPLSRPLEITGAHIYGKGNIMKRILQVAVVAMSFGAAVAYAQQRESAHDMDGLSVAQASAGAERVQREEPAARSSRPSMYDISGLAGSGSFPSRGGPIDD